MYNQYDCTLAALCSEVWREGMAKISLPYYVQSNAGESTVARLGHDGVM